MFSEAKAQPCSLFSHPTFISKAVYVPLASLHTFILSQLLTTLLSHLISSPFYTSSADLYRYIFQLQENIGVAWEGWNVEHLNDQSVHTCPRLPPLLHS